MLHYILDARTTTSHFPGIGRYVRNLAPALAAQLTPEEGLVVLWNPADASAWNPSGLAGPQVATLAAPVTPFSLRQQWLLPRLMGQAAHGGEATAGRRPPDGRQASTLQPPSALYHATYYLMPYRPGLPTVLTVYDLIALLYPETVSWRARLLFRLATGLALRAADRVIAISQATRSDLLAHFAYPPERVTAIPLAADPRFHPRSREEIRRVQAQYDLPEGYLLYLGINKPHKNLLTLLDAYAQLASRNTQAIDSPQLVIAGAWDERYPEPKRRVTTLGLDDRVRFLGPVSDADLPALYSGCLAFVFPSLYEGFGLPVLEAMACGVPVVCGDRSSLPEVAGDAALQVDPTNTSALATALREIVTDGRLRHILAQRGLEQAGRFSWQRTAAQTLTVYREMTSALL